MSNRLAEEQSPYLLQHKDNPVDWYPWASEAFDKARREDKPVFLSIGYSTCHWCHVMEHESFEDDDVARLMNEAFVSIKVDREERPDIDGVYMTACQMMTGQGGWPLTVIMTPDKEPFHVATYVPKTSRFGRVGMLDLVPRIRDVWENRRAEVLETAGKVSESLRRSASLEGSGETLGETTLQKAFDSLKERFDPTHGGFGNAPKFPSAHNLSFLLRYWKRTGEDAARDMVTATLEQMRLGGMFDHVGFGFHRYSTDRRWLLPHFEKMLYDQALLSVAYTEAYQATGEERLRSTAERVFEYALRDMRSPEGAFYSAEDADSEGREGKFYVWSVDEVRDVLPAELADLVIEVFNLSPEGNFEEEATKKRTGENVLHLREPVSEDADRLEEARRLLFEAREKRIRPGLDDKILTDWNGLMIAALAKASAAFGERTYAAAARDAAQFILDEMDDRGALLHRYRGGEAAVPGMLDDYAYFIWGLIELYETTFDTPFLQEALRLQERQIDRFWDDANGGFYFTADDAESLIVRQKEFYDGALPSGNAVSLQNMLRLSRLTGRTELEDRAQELVRTAAPLVSRMPAGFTGLLSALDFGIGPTSEIVISGSDGAEELLHVIRDGFRPNNVVLFRPDRGTGALEGGDAPTDLEAGADGGGPAIEEIAPFVAEQAPINGRAAAYVCREFRCEAPVSTPEELRRALD